MKKYIIALIILLVLTCGLIAVDILIRIWFQFDLVFDPVNFTNIGTPIIGIVSLVVYLITLLFLMKQNKVIQSQNLRPYFERQIDNIYNATKEKNFKIEIESGKFVEYNGLNFTDKLKEIFVELNGNQHYLQDVAVKGKKFPINYLAGRQYWKLESVLSMFTEDFWHLHFYDVQLLLKEISNSKIIDDEKIQLKNRIHRELLKEYMFMCRFMDKHRSFYFVSVIAEPDAEQNEILYEFKHIYDTAFSKYYKWFKDHLKNEGIF